MTEVGDWYVVLTCIELKSAKIMLQKLDDTSKFDCETETVTSAACSRAKYGFRSTNGTGRVSGVVCAGVVGASVEGTAVDAGGRVD